MKGLIFNKYCHQGKPEMKSFVFISIIFNGVSSYEDTPMKAVVSIKAVFIPLHTYHTSLYYCVTKT